MVTDTCKKKECPLWKKYKEKCPNLVERVFESIDKEIITVKDCAPIRTLLLTQVIHNDIIAMQKDYNSVRNSNVRVLDYLIAAAAPQEEKVIDAIAIDYVDNKEQKQGE